MADEIFKWIVVKENFGIMIKISLKFVPWGPTDNKSVSVQIMVWHWTCAKMLPELMLIFFDFIIS